MRRMITAALAVSVAAGTGAVAAPAALAKPGPAGSAKSSAAKAEFEQAGACSGTSVFEVEAKQRRGAIRTEFDVRTAVAGQTWNYSISDASGVIYQNSRMSWLDDDSDDLLDDSSSRSMRDHDDAKDDDGRDDDDSYDDDAVQGADDSYDDDVQGADDSYDDDMSVDGDSDDLVDDSVSGPVTPRAAQVEWKTYIEDGAGVITYTFSAVNADTGETCSVNVSL